LGIHPVTGEADALASEDLLPSCDHLRGGTFRRLARLCRLCWSLSLSRCSGWCPFVSGWCLFWLLLACREAEYRYDRQDRNPLHPAHMRPLLVKKYTVVSAPYRVRA